MNRLRDGGLDRYDEICGEGCGADDWTRWRIANLNILFNDEDHNAKSCKGKWSSSTRHYSPRLLIMTILQIKIFKNQDEKISFFFTQVQKN